VDQIVRYFQTFMTLIPRRRKKVRYLKYGFRALLLLKQEDRMIRGVSITEKKVDAVIRLDETESDGYRECPRSPT